MITFVDVEEARERIQNQIYLSPFPYSETISQLTGNRVFFKLENLQITGSFKERGALNRLLTLTPDEAQAWRHRRQCRQSRHGSRLSRPAAKYRGDDCYAAPRSSHQGQLGFGTMAPKPFSTARDYDAAFAEAQRLAQEKGLTFIHAFDDPWVVAGQGTIGLELYEQNPDLDAVDRAGGRRWIDCRHRSHSQDAQSEDSYHRRSSRSRPIHESRSRKRGARFVFPPP